MILYLKFKKGRDEDVYVTKEAYVNSCKVWNEKYLISYIEKEDENYYFLNYKKAEKEK